MDGKLLHKQKSRSYLAPRLQRCSNLGDFVYEVGRLNQESSDICEIRPFFFFSLNIVIHSQPEDEMNVWILEKLFLQTSLGCS